MVAFIKYMIFHKNVGFDEALWVSPGGNQVDGLPPAQVSFLKEAKFVLILLKEKNAPEVIRRPSRRQKS